jgi:hypothetical protein
MAINLFNNLLGTTTYSTARQNTIASQQQAEATTDAPSNATAAPKGNTKDVFTGLAEALNTWQKKLADPQNPKRKYNIADIYEFEFVSPIGDARVKRQGTTDKSKVPMQTDNTAKSKLDSATNSTNNAARTVQVSAGMQIVQFIDEVMRTSTYITDQQLYLVDEVPDPKTGVQKIKPNPTPPKGTAWYKINVQATQLGYDEKRHDHAYKMKFVITPYAINSAPSDWFKNSRYRGSHKSYNYWFTGENKEILHFEQEYNHLYRLIISGLNVPSSNLPRSDFRDQYRRTYMPTSENHAKNGDGYANEPGDNLASYLYSPTDQAIAKLKIVGDPAWLQQGEISTGVSAQTFNFSPFNNDGGINYDGQEIVFDISWNRPQDYNFNTGLMNLNRSQVKPDGTYSAQPQENAAYVAVKCKNIFSKGRFEQELEGRLLIEYDKTGTSSTTQTNTKPQNSTTGNNDSRIGNLSTTIAATGDNDWTREVQRTSGEPAPNSNNEWTDEVARTNDTETILPADAPELPTSDGDITPANTLSFGEEIVGEVDNPINQNMAKDE